MKIEGRMNEPKLKEMPFIQEYGLSSGALYLKDHRVG